MNNRLIAATVFFWLAMPATAASLQNLPQVAKAEDLQVVSTPKTERPSFLSQLSPAQKAAVCDHLGASKANFENVLGTRVTEMPALRAALKAIESVDLQSACGGQQ